MSFFAGSGTRTAANCGLQHRWAALLNHWDIQWVQRKLRTRLIPQTVSFWSAIPSRGYKSRRCSIFFAVVATSIRNRTRTKRYFQTAEKMRRVLLYGCSRKLDLGRVSVRCYVSIRLHFGFQFDHFWARMSPPRSLPLAPMEIHPCKCNTLAHFSSFQLPSFFGLWHLVCTLEGVRVFQLHCRKWLSDG